MNLIVLIKVMVMMMGTDEVDFLSQDHIYIPETEDIYD